MLVISRFSLAILKETLLLAGQVSKFRHAVPLQEVSHT